MSYIVKDKFSINAGFSVNAKQINDAVVQTNTNLQNLPYTLYRSIDFKTTSAVIGSIFCDTLAANVKHGIVNPIEKGHPDIIPVSGANASEEELRNYPQGLEIKCTVGNIKKGAKLKAGKARITKLEGITWQAHHREVNELLGLIWDFVNSECKFNFPVITGAFYSDTLIEDDWGKISGTTGRNTKVTGMKISGKLKMGSGWIALIDRQEYLDKFERLLNVDLPNMEGRRKKVQLLLHII